MTSPAPNNAAAIAAQINAMAGAPAVGGGNFVPPDGSYADHWKPTTFNSPNGPGFDATKPTAYRDQFGEWSVPDTNDYKGSLDPATIEQMFASQGKPAAVSPAAQQIAAQINKTAGEQVVSRGSLLPIGTTAAGDKVLAVPEFIHGPMTSISDVLSGKRLASQLTPQEIFDMGALFAGTGFTKFVGPAGAAKAVSPVAAAGQRIGVDVPRAASSEGVVTSSASNITSSVPFGGTPVRKAADKALGQLDQAATDVQAALGQGSVPEAGAVLRTGVTDYAGKGGFLSTTVNSAYDKVDTLIDPAATGGLGETAAVASRIDAEREAAGTTPSKAVAGILEAVTRPEGLTYAGAKKLRTIIGETLGSPQALATAGVSEAELKQIYGALTDDMGAIVQKAGGKDAVAAWDSANSLAQEASATRENLARVLNANSDEQIFSKLQAMTGTTSRGDVATLGQVRTAVGDKNWGEVVSALIERWGFNEQGDFEPGKFVTQWNKVTQDAKSVVFQTEAEKKQLAALNDIATVSAKADEMAALAEPKKGGVVKGALGLGGASALMGVSFSPWTAILPIVSSRVISNVLAKPEGAAAFATWAKAYQAFVGSPSMGTTAVLRKASTALAFRAAIETGVPPASAAVQALATKLANSPATQAQNYEQGRKEVLDQQMKSGNF